MGLPWIEDDTDPPPPDDRSSGPPPPERPSCTVAIPIAPVCGHPCHEEHQRRGLCVSCYRKLGEANALPPKRAAHRDRVHPLRRWLGTLDSATLLRLRAWIEEIERMGR